MALTLVITSSNPGEQVAGVTGNYVVAITNTSSSSVTLNALSVFGQAGDGVSYSQPNFLTPNVPVGVGNPTLIAAGTSYFAFQATFPSPYSAGPSPQAPGGAAPGPAAFPADPFFVLTAQAQASDGSVGSSSLFVPVLSTIAPFPLATGGAFQFSQGFNFINGLTTGAL